MRTDGRTGGADLVPRLGPQSRRTHLAVPAWPPPTLAIPYRWQHMVWPQLAPGRQM